MRTVAVKTKDQLAMLGLYRMRAQLARSGEIEEELRMIERRIRSWRKQQSSCQAIAEIPGVGLLMATALVAILEDPRTFKSGREFAAFLGLVPRQRGTGGKVLLGAISKRGDVYLRTLLIHEARSVLFNAKDKSVWAQALLGRRPTNVAAVALANKMARTAWALLAHERSYQRDYVSIKPASS